MPVLGEVSFIYFWEGNLGHLRERRSGEVIGGSRVHASGLNRNVATTQRRMTSRGRERELLVRAGVGGVCVGQPTKETHVLSLRLLDTPRLCAIFCVSRGGGSEPHEQRRQNCVAFGNSTEACRRGEGAPRARCRQILAKSRRRYGTAT